MEFVCCFCYEHIKAEGNDPCSLGIETCYARDVDEDSRRYQGFFCHLECFKQKVDSGVLINMGYLLYGDDDIDS